MKQSKKLQRLRAILTPAAFLAITLVGCAGMAFNTLVDGPPVPGPTSSIDGTLSPSGQGEPQIPVAAGSCTPIDQTEEPSLAHLALVGDLMLGRSVNTKNISLDDFSWPFQETAEILRDADLTMGNLETPIVNGCPPKDMGLIFCADPRTVEGLTFAGFDVVSLANNHALNYEQKGLDETVQLLGDARIGAAINGGIVVEEVDGMRIGVMALDDTDRTLDIDETVAAVEQAAGQVDILVGYIHWGYEYRPNASRRQQELGRALIDAGMDIIAGAHPHWLQPIEEYNGGVIFYSLGNFVADQMWSKETRVGVIAQVTIEKYASNRVIRYDLVPVKLFDMGQPQLIDCPADDACKLLPDGGWGTGDGG